MTFVLNIVLSILPVFIFLIVLIYIDSFKLIKHKTLLITLIVGALSALIAMYVNIWLLELLNMGRNFVLYSRYVAPFVEELLKVLFPIYLLKSRKFAFMVDGAIYGFAVGAGFAFIENLFYLNTLQDPNLLLWVVRGFGTAVMHGGSTAIFAILLKSILDRKVSEKWYYFIPPLLTAILIHSLFNHFFWGPLITVAAQLIFLPVLIIVAFKYSEKVLKEWLDLGLDVDVWLLDNIINGTIHDTKIGEYLDSLKKTFPGEMIADMLCYLRLHVELSIHAKGVLLMREAGFDVNIDRDTREKFMELKHLQKTIGKTGQLALSPIMLNTARDLWQFYFIDEKKAI
jgi:protease PrsW